MPDPVVKPSIGRIVRYMPRATINPTFDQPAEVPAIIVAVHGEGPIVNLKVFFDQSDKIEDSYERDVAYSEEKESNTWHWPKF